MTTNFDLAPPPVTTGGITIVPVDLQSMDARLVFDGASSSASGDATITFVVGPTSGRPMFDLRQPITGVWLDGAPLATTAILTRDPGGGPGAEMRVLDVVLAAGSTHTLRLTYGVGLPNAPAGGSYQPGLSWSPGPRLTWNVGFTDLRPGRYLEAWVPANLIWDQYTISIEVEVTGTAVPHSLIANGSVTALSPNHWRVAHPATATAMSTLLEVRPSDTLSRATSVVTLPSGTAVTIEGWKLSSNTTVSLPAQLGSVATWLAENDTSMGTYPHGDRFVAFVHQGGMEYDGACTSGTGALRHETYHSWWGRGVRPATQADAWFDEGWNTYHDNGGSGATPLDFSAAPRTLCDRSPYRRATAGNAYGDGDALFNGIAALTSPAGLTSWMGEISRSRRDRPITTLDIEAHLLARSGRPEVVDAFHRFAFGLPDPSPGPDLWLRDDPAHTGTEQWNGRFWDSPDLWIRHEDDGGTTHQAPRAGRDNWFYARVRNRGAGLAGHFMVTFQIRQFAGVQFRYPLDFLPAIAATGGFDLAPGGEAIVRAKWPAALVPPAGTHACWLAAVFARGDRPIDGRHVWEHGNLAQKNLTIVRARRGAVIDLAFLTTALSREVPVVLELRRPKALTAMRVELLARDDRHEPLLAPGDVAGGLGAVLECGAHHDDDADGGPSDPVGPRFGEVAVARFRGGTRARTRLELPTGPVPLALRLRVPRRIELGDAGVIDLLQLDRRGRPVGGIAVELHIDD